MRSVFHVSETAGISLFTPRAGENNAPRVWAIAPARLHNYLLPRDCPRVTYYAHTATNPADRARFFSNDPHESVVAIEREWLPRVRAVRLHLYHLPAEPFTCIDEIAGYFVSPRPVVPERCEVIDDVIAALLARSVTLRVLGTLWPLRDEVVQSTLAFSIIRMRNARPREPTIAPETKPQ